MAGAVEGAAIEGVPTYNTQLTGKYNFTLFEDKSGFVLAAAHWVGSSHGTLNPTDPDYYRPAYHTLDLSTGMSFDYVDVTIYAKNALNNDTVIQHPDINGTTEGYRVNPRTVGMTISSRF